MFIHWETSAVTRTELNLYGVRHTGTQAPRDTGDIGTQAPEDTGDIGTHVSGETGDIGTQAPGVRATIHSFNNYHI